MPLGKGNHAQLPQWDALDRTQDAIATYGPTELCKSLLPTEFDPRCIHTDITNFNVIGAGEIAITMVIRKNVQSDSSVLSSGWLQTSTSFALSRHFRNESNNGAIQTILSKIIFDL